ncbi:MAG: 4-hydroxy-tetrahydrodipicolinate reductase [Proteobacteria bacterium]|nr:4-hydroxy-tetrahydrodipicolinate reductase [Pseudomonadota bacterium]
MTAVPAVRVALLGASGRMGRSVLTAAASDPNVQVCAALVSPGSSTVGASTGAAQGLTFTSDLAALEAAQVVIDFSTASATQAHLAACVRLRRALVVCSTGQGPQLEANYAAAAREIALLVAPNTSLGVTLLTELAQRAARALPGYRLAIRETHHVHKRDAPSGTALALAAALRAGRGAGGEIPIDSQREGEVVGEHEVILEGPGERLCLAHEALDRAVFAQGALAAALWLAPRPPGRYLMRDVLDSKTVT